MDIKEQVLSIEQARHLQELGLDMSDAALCYEPYEDYNDFTSQQYKVNFNRGFNSTIYGREVYAYTLQEILSKLPETIKIDFRDCGTLYRKGILAFDCDRIGYQTSSGAFIIGLHFDDKDNRLDTTYKLLCWVLENGYLKEDKK